MGSDIQGMIFLIGRGENGRLAGPLFYMIFVVEIVGNIRNHRF